jgi:hypothetical protein
MYSVAERVAGFPDRVRVAVAAVASDARAILFGSRLPAVRLPQGLTLAEGSGSLSRGSGVRNIESGSAAPYQRETEERLERLPARRVPAIPYDAP